MEHIIQDGSDGTGLEWLGYEPRARVCVEKDCGMYDALAKGIAKATGSIVAHLNSDEQYLPGSLKLVKEFFDTHPDIEVVFGDAILTDTDGRLLSYRRTVSPLRLHTIACHLSTLTCSTFFRRTIVDRGLSYTTEWRAIGDLALVLSWLDAGVKMATISQPLAVFTFTGGNMGNGLESHEEGARHWTENSLGPLNLSRLLAAQHRLRKFFAGAYRTRDIAIEIYTRESPEIRQTIRAQKLGFGWPKAS